MVIRPGPSNDDIVAAVLVDDVCRHPASALHHKALIARGGKKHQDSLYR